MFDRMRWFLREGWGNMPEYVTDEALMQSDRATLVLPCYTPAPIELTLAMSAAHEIPVRVAVNGQALGAGTVGTQRTRLRFLIPRKRSSAATTSWPWRRRTPPRPIPGSTPSPIRLLPDDLDQHARLGRRPSNSP